jgi:hypothetical protein
VNNQGCNDDPLATHIDKPGEFIEVKPIALLGGGGTPPSTARRANLASMTAGPEPREPWFRPEPELRGALVREARTETRPGRSRGASDLGTAS